MSNLKLKDIKNARTAYLYSDQHLVIVYEKKDKDARRVEWVQIWEDCGVKCLFPIESGGRVIMDKEFLPFFINLTKLEVSVGVKQGSKNTEKMGLTVQSIILHTKGTGFGWLIAAIPSLISSDIYWHIGNNEKFTDMLCEHDSLFKTSVWGGHHIKQVFRKEKNKNEKR